jgi:biotin carboxylase
MMDLSNKTLLLMGGGAYAKGIKAYQDKMGFRIVAVGKDPSNPIARIADVSYVMDTQNVDGIVEIVKEEKVDGIFVGSSEVNISPAIDVAERTGARFYVNRQQWDIVANKARFKEFARNSGFPVIPEFKLSSNPSREEVAGLQFPVMIKPVDSSGARGLNPCYKAEDFMPLYEEALRWSPRREVIVESLITDAEDICVCYTIQDGESTLSYSFTKDVVRSENHYVSLPIFHLYPSRFLDQYYKEADEAAKEMFCKMGLKNGTINLQGFYKDGKFFFYEAGYRMGGAQAYILTEYMNGCNVLNYMINYVLTGSMYEERLAEKEDAHFPYPCCNYYVELKAGTIDHIEGIDEVEAMRGVLNVTQMCHEGDVILETNEIGRAIYRIHVVGDSMEDLAQRLVNISQTMKIMSTEGYEMQIEPLKYERCFKTIKDKIVIK